MFRTVSTKTSYTKHYTLQSLTQNMTNEWHNVARSEWLSKTFKIVTHGSPVRAAFNFKTPFVRALQCVNCSQKKYWFTDYIHFSSISFIRALFEGFCFVKRAPSSSSCKFVLVDSQPKVQIIIVFRNICPHWLSIFSYPFYKCL